MGMTKEQAEQWLKQGQPGAGRFPYLADSKNPKVGDFELEIEEMKNFQGQQDRKQKYVAVARVTASTNPERPVGERVQCYWCPEDQKFPQYQIQEINQLVAAICGGEHEASDLVEAFSDANPCKGVKVKASVYRDNKGYAKFNFSAATS